MITITLFSGTSILSKLIKFFQGGPVSHCGIGITLDGTPMFLHASLTGVQLTPREVLLKDHTIVAEFEIIPDIQNEIKPDELRIGQSYDFIGLLGYLPIIFFRKFGIKINNPFASKSAAVCSEFVIEADVYHKIKEFDGLIPQDITPQDLYNICLNGTSFRKI
jgi:hypothetical protein